MKTKSFFLLLASAVILALPSCDPYTTPDGMLDIVKIVNDLQGKSLKDVEAKLVKMGFTLYKYHDIYNERLYYLEDESSATPRIQFTIEIDDESDDLIITGIQTFADADVCRKKWINQYQPAMKLPDAISHAFDNDASEVDFSYEVFPEAVAQEVDIQAFGYVKEYYYDELDFGWGYCSRPDVDKEETCYYYSLDNENAGVNNDGLVKWTTPELISHINADLKAHTSARNGLTNQEYAARYSWESFELESKAKDMKIVTVIRGHFDMERPMISYSKGREVDDWWDVVLP